MLSDKEIIKISKAASDISLVNNCSPTFALQNLLCYFEYGRKDKIDVYNRCKQWLFDNQQYYPFSIAKEDMLY